MKFLLKSIALALPLMLSAMSANAETPLKVNVLYPSISQSQQALILTGTVIAKQHSDMAPLQSGLVRSLYVDQGEQVTKGQKLLTLDSKLAELQLEQSKAAVAAAKTNKKEADRLYKEVLALSQKELIAKTLLEERIAAIAIAEADLARDMAQLALRQEMVDRHTLYAPFTGVIAKRNVDLGEWVTEQMSVFTLVARDGLRLSLEIPQEYYARLASEQDIEVILLSDFGEHKSSRVTLSQLVGVVNNSSRTLTALVDLPKDTYLIAGMSAKAEILLPKDLTRLTWLPKSAIKQHPDGGASVFTLEDNKSKRYLVEIVERQPDMIAIKGIPEGVPIVTSGVELLTEGVELEVDQITGEAQ
ncbi:efflux RND transporter periplasmic adaptor subunit [Paraferrimonas sedimenticola]|uniref:CzcB-like barrel-sandwich hybrid domain-containing protein n=1 Tax=Paraferrimonas sedimenticola TaxID=375674 RepID=A0AA37W2B8_9GAMM|nr:efflux RND transporter periplasmic adaptor subunit [Paraferrimonas sedimenticola]GLP97647.1 hypothetical protein GCM10007895_29540 [Paraferrimonas sedimenticola]